MELIVFTKLFTTRHFPCAPRLDSCGTSSGRTSHFHFVTSLVTSTIPRALKYLTEVFQQASRLRQMCQALLTFLRGK